MRCAVHLPCRNFLCLPRGILSMRFIMSTTTFLRRRTVEAKTGLSRSTIYQRIKDGTGPHRSALRRLAGRRY